MRAGRLAPTCPSPLTSRSVSVEARHRLYGVLSITGKNAEGQSRLMLWRNLESMDNEVLEGCFADERADLPGQPDTV